MSTCSVVGCESNAIRSGMCSKHVQRFDKYGTADDYLGCHGLTRICTVDGCGQKVDARGLCRKHYQRFRRYGTPDDVGPTHAPVEVRFWRYVEKTESCWNWVGKSKNRQGYGQIQSGGKGTPHKLAHRLSYEIHKGAIPDGLVVMHSCDNPSCVNPDHLSVGTHSQNTKDAFARGLATSVPPHKFGESHGAAKLKESDVYEIRASKESSTILVARYGVSKSAINRIRQRVTWSHLPD